MQLLSRGIESRYLNGRPKFSPYVKKYEKYLPFGVDTTEIPVDARFGMTTSGAVYTAYIANDTCDMILDAHLVLTWAAKEVKQQLPQDSPHAFVDFVEVKVGGQVLSRWNGELLTCYEDITRDPVTYTVDDYLAGKHVDYGGNVTQDIRRGGEFAYRIPLLGNKIQDAFPLCALRHHSLEVRIGVSDAVKRTGTCVGSVRIRGAYLSGIHRKRFAEYPLHYTFTMPSRHELYLDTAFMRIKNPVYAACLCVRSNDTSRLDFKRCVTEFSISLGGSKLFTHVNVLDEYQHAKAFSRYPVRWKFFGRDLNDPKGAINFSRFSGQSYTALTDGSEGDGASKILYTLAWQLIIFKDGLAGIPYQ